MTKSTSKSTSSRDSPKSHVGGAYEALPADVVSCLDGWTLGCYCQVSSFCWFVSFEVGRSSWELEDLTLFAKLGRRVLKGGCTCAAPLSSARADEQ